MDNQHDYHTVPDQGASLPTNTDCNIAAECPSSGSKLSTASLLAPITRLPALSTDPRYHPCHDPTPRSCSRAADADARKPVLPLLKRSHRPPDRPVFSCPTLTRPFGYPGLLRCTHCCACCPLRRPQRPHERCPAGSCMARVVRAAHGDQL